MRCSFPNKLRIDHCLKVFYTCKMTSVVSKKNTLSPNSITPKLDTRHKSNLSKNVNMSDLKINLKQKLSLLKYLRYRKLMFTKTL